MGEVVGPHKLGGSTTVPQVVRGLRDRTRTNCLPQGLLHAGAATQSTEVLEEDVCYVLSSILRSKVDVLLLYDWATEDLCCHPGLVLWAEAHQVPAAVAGA